MRERALIWMATAAALAAPIAGSLLARQSDALTSYAALSPLQLGAAIAPGVLLGVAGGWLLGWPPGRRTGGLALLAAVLWSLPDWNGWDDGPALARSLAELVPEAALVLVLAAACGVWGRWLTVSATLLAAAAAVRALVRDPFLAAGCWRNCSDNLFRIGGDAAAGAAADRAVLLASVAAALAVAVMAARRRHVLAGLAMAVGAKTTLTLIDGPEDPERDAFGALQLVLAVAVSVLALTLGARRAAALRRSARIRRLASELAEMPESDGLATMLAERLGDRTLRVAFPLPSGGWVDDRGDDTAPPATCDGRAVATVTRRGGTIAVIEHDARALEADAIERELRPAARLALENGGLRAVLHAQLRSLAEVRRRVVHNGDEARRRLERDLHDGAQQTLIALLIDLRLAGADQDAIREMEAAVAELREIAHGIHPAALTEEGVAFAVDGLIHDAPLVVEDDLTEDRFAPDAELAAYLLFAETLGTPGESARLQLRVQDGAVVAEAEHEGPQPPELDEVADRFAALAGLLEVERRGSRTRVRGRMPLS